jgi:hypothetical protein
MHDLVRAEEDLALKPIDYILSHGAGLELVAHAQRGCLGFFNDSIRLIVEYYVLCHHSLVVGATEDQNQVVIKLN